MENIKIGDVVRPIHCDRSQWMSDAFKEWIEKNSTRTFLVANKIDRSCILKGVYFTVTEEFLVKVGS